MPSGPPADPLAPYRHREVTLDAAGRRLTFATSLSLFSSHQVDVGSRLLLRTLEPTLAGAAGWRALDLGCGYGPLAVALAAHPGVEAVLAVDRDALAVDFTRDNARRNGLAGRVTAEPGLGLDDVPDDQRFDLAVSNVPGKAGDAPIRALLLGALARLSEGGLAAVVVIEPIRDLVAATLAAPDVEVTLRRDTADYTVFHYRLRPGAARPVVRGFADGIYDRGTLAFEDAAGRPLRIETVEALPGYDRLSPLEVALAARLPALEAGATALISPVGQGALAALLWRAQPAARLILADRDLLALRAARRALLSLGASPEQVETHAVGTTPPGALAARADVAVAALREDGGAASVQAEYAALLHAMAPGGRAILAGSSTAITRLLDRATPPGWRTARTRHRGMSVLEVTPPD